jgi:tRNA-Thr(GGU) m(6)t(6)A37 methyltransferase TsaA
MEPIGYLKSSFVDKFGTPRQPGLAANSRAELKIRADLQPELALQGLEGFSHVWLIFVFHKNESSRYHAKVHPPRLGGESMGLFATRTPHRPNPIGLSLVEVIKVEKDTVTLGGVDLIDGTPILDIKPYLPAIESKPDARVGWTGEVPQRNIQIEFSPEAEATLKAWQQKQEVDLKKHIQEVLALDPRPNVYKGYEGQQSPYRQEHRVRLFDGDVHFEFLSAELVRVLRIIWPYKGPDVKTP